jgi:hypothetical protein
MIESPTANGSTEGIGSIRPSPISGPSRRREEGSGDGAARAAVGRADEAELLANLPEANLPKANLPKANLRVKQAHSQGKSVLIREKGNRKFGRERARFSRGVRARLKSRMVGS